MIRVKMSTSRPSIKDIAKLAGVTDITVSRAFTSPEKVKKETREKIYVIANQLNYIPNIFARNIRKSDSKIIGLVADDIFNPVYAYIIKELNILAENLGYSIMIFNTNGSFQSEVNAINTLLSYNVAGMVISVIEDGYYCHEHLKNLLKSGAKIIQFDRQFSETLPGVFIDDYYAGELAGSQAKGRTLIVGGPQHSKITQRRIHGIMQTLPEDTNPIVIYTDYHQEKVINMLHEFSNENEFNFNSVISVTGLISLAVMSVFHCVGKTVRLVSIDEIPYSHIYRLNCIYVNHNYNEWAHLVAKGLFDDIILNNPPSRTFIKGKLNFLRN